MGSNNGSNFPGLALGLSFNSDQQNIQCIPIIKEKQEKGKSGLVLKFDHVLPCLSLGSIPGRSHGLIGDPAGSSISPGSSDSNSSSMKRVKDIGDGILDVDKTVMSRGSDDDEDGCTRKKLRLNKEQSAVLEDSFKEHSTLNPTQKEALARQLKLRTRQVEVWFQNRRARTKLKQTEMDCELLKKCCQNLTDENKRLQMELQELRALNLPVLMQMPVATLTICPSCERLNSASGGEGGCLGGGGGKSQLKGPLNNPFARSSTC